MLLPSLTHRPRQQLATALWIKSYLRSSKVCEQHPANPVELPSRFCGNYTERAFRGLTGIILISESSRIKWMFASQVERRSTRQQRSSPCTWASEGFFPRGASSGFCEEVAKIFFQDKKQCEILFYHLKTKRKTFFYQKINGKIFIYLFKNSQWWQAKAWRGHW